MHTHRTALWRWLRLHHRELATAAALAAASVVLVALAPPLLAVAAVEWKRGRHRNRLLSLALTLALVRAVVWLWRDLRGVPHSCWHPCAQCGRPIEHPSRAAYCSHECRTHARLQRDLEATDPWVAERAKRRLRGLADTNPEWDEVPF